MPNEFSTINMNIKPRDTIAQLCLPSRPGFRGAQAVWLRSAPQHPGCLPLSRTKLITEELRRPAVKPELYPNVKVMSNLHADNDYSLRPDDGALLWREQKVTVVDHMWNTLERHFERTRIGDDESVFRERLLVEEPWFPTSLISTFCRMATISPGIGRQTGTPSLSRGSTESAASGRLRSSIDPEANSTNITTTSPKKRRRAPTTTSPLARYKKQPRTDAVHRPTTPRYPSPHEFLSVQQRICATDQPWEGVFSRAHYITAGRVIHEGTLKNPSDAIHRVEVAENPPSPSQFLESRAFPSPTEVRAVAQELCRRGYSISFPHGSVTSLPTLLLHSGRVTIAEDTYETLVNHSETMRQENGEATAGMDGPLEIQRWKVYELERRIHQEEPHFPLTLIQAFVDLSFPLPPSTPRKRFSSTSIVSDNQRSTPSTTFSSPLSTVPSLTTSSSIASTSTSLSSLATSPSWQQQVSPEPTIAVSSSASFDEGSQEQRLWAEFDAAASLVGFSEPEDDVPCLHAVASKAEKRRYVPERKPQLNSVTKGYHAYPAGITKARFRQVHTVSQESRPQKASRPRNLMLDMRSNRPLHRQPSPPQIRSPPAARTDPSLQLQPGSTLETISSPIGKASWVQFRATEFSSFPATDPTFGVRAYDDYRPHAVETEHSAHVRETEISTDRDYFFHVDQWVDEGEVVVNGADDDDEP